MEPISLPGIIAIGFLILSFIVLVIVRNRRK